MKQHLWEIANNARININERDFKEFIFCILIYRLMSEDFAHYMEGGEEAIDYKRISARRLSEEIKQDAIKTKGYFIYPKQLFCNVAAKANTNRILCRHLSNIFNEIESSAIGYPSENNIKGLFANFNIITRVRAKNKRLAEVLNGIAELDFGKASYGKAFDYYMLRSKYESKTPLSLGNLIINLALHNQTKVNKIYDPAAGSGSLLLQAKKQFDNHIIEDGFYGQEINPTAYNLARMNMSLHNINYYKFKFALGDALINPKFGDEKPFDAIVSNPPYSSKWIGSDDPMLAFDERYSPAGILAPKSKADFAFIAHVLSYLSERGRAVLTMHPAALCRRGSEQRIREWLIKSNFVDTVIALAPNLLYGTSIAVNILVLAKNKTNRTTQFIDASKLFKKETDTNILTDKHIEEILQVFASKQDVKYFAKSVDKQTIADNEYNLSVSAYV